ncbi:hypothetical protein EJB05_50203, partial [Eragrostis curvula]
MGVKGEIEELKEELASMNVALHKASEVLADQLDELVKIWVRDTFSFKGFIHRNINLLKKAGSNHQIHNVIKDIMKQVKIVNERSKRYKVDDISVRRTIAVTVDPRLEAMYAKATELVGIDGPKNELAKRLMDEGGSSGQKPKIISIVGFGGLGKTTLANALFHDLKEKFDCYVFVSVSLNPDIVMILRNMLCRRDGCPPGFSEVTGKILTKCGGVPLAIITTASLLASKPMYSVEWERVNDTIGSGLENSPDVDKMTKILSLSYNGLTSNLKTCLLSLSKYPDAEVIRKDTLIWSWIAEGFITEETRSLGTSLQDIGESYFNELINRSWIQPVDIGSFYDQDGQVHACQVHDMVLEVINQLSAEDDFVTRLRSDDHQAGARPFAGQERKIRRLSLHYSNKTYASSPEAREHLSRVRSLTIFGIVDPIPPLSSFHVLRVLQLEDCSSLNNNNLNDLSELRHLRFLRLRRYSAAELPDSIWKLESLGTLDIRDACQEMIMLPISIVKLRKLVRLFTDGVELQDGLALGDIKSLQELVGIYFAPEVIKEIANLRDLRVLRFIVDEDMVLEDAYFTECILMCLQRCTNLQYLGIKASFLASCSLDSMQQVPSRLQGFICSDMTMAAFPRWINLSRPSCLTTLSIKLDVDTLLPHHLQKLAELPSLCFLRLVIVGERELEKISIPSGAFAFRCLRYFHLYSPSMFLKFEPGTMPKLQRLCFRLYNLIEAKNLKYCGLDKLQSLRHVTIECMDLVLKNHHEAEAAFRVALKDNPNHPSFEFI